MSGPAIVMVHIVCPSVCLSHMNISETKRDRCMVTRKLEYSRFLVTICLSARDQHIFAKFIVLVENGVPQRVKWSNTVPSNIQDCRQPPSLIS